MRGGRRYSALCRGGNLSTQQVAGTSGVSTAEPCLELRPDHLSIIWNVLRNHLPDRNVVAFGSRATWTAKEYSDLNLAILGDEPLALDTTSALAERFSESDLPFKVDLVDWARTDETFRDVIRCSGVYVHVPGWCFEAISTKQQPSIFRKSGGIVCRLGEYTEIVMGQSPPGDTCNTCGKGVPLLNGPTEFGSHHPNPVQFTTNPRKIALPGDLLFCVRGSTTGRMNWADQEYAIGRGVAAIHDKRGRQFQPFVRGVVEFGLNDLLAQATGSTFPNVSAQQLATLSWPILDVSEQRAIAHILGTLDDKIELNNRMNLTLEAMARAIFKDWFVDFGPIRAKAEGGDPYLAPEYWDLFPDALDRDGKPVGWRTGILSDVADTQRRSVGPTDVAENTPYIGLKHMPRRSIALTEWDGAGKVKSNKSVFKQGEFLFGKLSPCFHKVGFAPLDGICSTDIVIVVPRDPDWAAFTLACLSSDEFVDYTDRTSTGTIMSRTSWKTMGIYKICLPSEQVDQVFQNMVQPLLERVNENIHESHTLAQIRDILLPKLMSGEIRVDEAEAVEAATK